MTLEERFAPQNPSFAHSDIDFSQPAVSYNESSGTVRALFKWDYPDG